MSHPKAGEWWCPGAWHGRDQDGRDSYKGCDGSSDCEVCHGRSMSEVLEARVSSQSWWKRESRTYKGEMLRGWANLLASRYARPVYLVGGALRELVPRDLDVRVIMSKSEFEDRFGKLGDQLHGTRHCLYLENMDEQRRWHVEVAKMNRQGAQNTHLPIDFQVQPLLESLGHLRDPRVRLDDVPGLIPPWED